MKGRVLLVDDNVDFLDSTRDVLEDEGYEVATATNGEQGVSLVSRQSFDVVLMDLKMPGMNGVESFVEMKRLQPGVRVVLVTAYPLDQLVCQAREEGVCEVLSKPVEMERLFDAIERAKAGGRAGFILIADDDKELCANLVDTLRGAGYDVGAAYDGEEAVSKAKEQPCDVILLDMKLPPVNGLEVYRRIRGIRPEVVAVIITGYAEEYDDIIRQALEENVQTCLTKPLEMATLLELLQEICAAKWVGSQQKHLG